MMKDTDCKANTCGNLVHSNDDRVIDASLFEKILSRIKCGDHLYTDIKRCTHET